MTDFTPIEATLGGLLIGAGAVLLQLANGRIAGISGIAGGALRPQRGDLSWRLLFLAGLPLGAALCATRLPSTFSPAADWPVLVAGGLLVGYGTQLGNGCTSGHGVCGISRGSPRSLAATGTFMGVAAVTVFVLRHVLGVGS